MWNYHRFKVGPKSSDCCLGMKKRTQRQREEGQGETERSRWPRLLLTKSCQEPLDIWRDKKGFSPRAYDHLNFRFLTSRTERINSFFFFFFFGGACVCVLGWLFVWGFLFFTFHFTFSFSSATQFVAICNGSTRKPIQGDCATHRKYRCWFARCPTETILRLLIIGDYFYHVSPQEIRQSSIFLFLM